MSARKTRRLIGIAFVLVAFTLVAAWSAYAAWSSPRATGLQLVDGAALSAIPLGLALIAFVWGMALVHASRDRRKP